MRIPLLFGLLVLVGFAFLLGRLDEIYFVLGALPLFLGWVTAYLLGRHHGPVKGPMLGLYCLLLGAALWGGRYVQAEAIFAESWGILTGEVVQGVDAFGHFLEEEVGRHGILGFLEIRMESGLRLFGDRGLELFGLGGGLQILIEFMAFYSGLRGLNGAGQFDRHTEEFQEKGDAE